MELSGPVPNDPSMEICGAGFYKVVSALLHIEVLCAVDTVYWAGA